MTRFSQTSPATPNSKMGFINFFPGKRNTKHLFYALKTKNAPSRLFLRMSISRNQQIRFLRTLSLKDIFSLQLCFDFYHIKINDKLKKSHCHSKIKRDSFILGWSVNTGTEIMSRLPVK